MGNGCSGKNKKTKVPDPPLDSEKPGDIPFDGISSTTSLKGGSGRKEEESERRRTSGGSLPKNLEEQLRNSLRKRREARLSVDSYGTDATFKSNVTNESFLSNGNGNGINNFDGNRSSSYFKKRGSSGSEQRRVTFFENFDEVTEPPLAPPVPQRDSYRTNREGFRRSRSGAPPEGLPVRKKYSMKTNLNIIKLAKRRDLRDFSFDTLIRISKVVSVYDGDTCRVAFLWKEKTTKPEIIMVSVRLYGIDCPELRSRNHTERGLALESKEKLQSLLTSVPKNGSMDNNNKLVVIAFGKNDKYGRPLATFYDYPGYRKYIESLKNINTLNFEKSINYIMIKDGKATEYLGNTKTKIEYSQTIK